MGKDAEHALGAILNSSELLGKTQKSRDKLTRCDQSYGERERGREKQKVESAISTPTGVLTPYDPSGFQAVSVPGCRVEHYNVVHDSYAVSRLEYL